MKALLFYCGVVLVVLIATGAVTAAQAQIAPQQAVGQVTATGDVTLNGMPVPGATTLLPGSRLRTGARSSAVVSVAGRGQFLLGENSEAAFPSSRGDYFTELISGSGALKVEVNQTLDVLAGRFLIRVRQAPASAIEISFQEEGTVQALCRVGSALVIDLDGPEAAALSTGDLIRLFRDGRIVPVASGEGAPARQTPSGAGKKVALVLLIVGGAGGAAAALALGRGEESPSRP
jgi:hypothetical protein